MAHTEIRAIFFDAAGTLIHLPRGPAWHYREVALRFGCDLDVSQLKMAFREAWNAMPHPPETRRRREDDDRGWWRELVERTLDRCGVKPGDLDRSRYFGELYREFAQPGVWDLYPEIPETLERLRGRYLLGIISNFDGRLRRVLELLGIAHHFQTLTISSEVGADKPSPWIFEQALASAGIEARHALHVGDDAVCDWQGAERAGLRSFRLERPANSLRDLPV